jgi:hypothetical protein
VIRSDSQSAESRPDNTGDAGKCREAIVDAIGAGYKPVGQGSPTRVAKRRRRT